MKSNSYAQRYPLAGRRWRYADSLQLAAALALGMTAAAAMASCPPVEADGAAIKSGDLVLAYRPVAKAGTGAKTIRIPMAKHFALDVQVCDKGGAARLSRVDATMPEHRHGMNYRPVIRPLDGGRYAVDGLMFHMAGHWQFVFEVQSGKDVVRLSHDVQVE